MKAFSDRGGIDKISAAQFTAKIIVDITQSDFNRLFRLDLFHLCYLLQLSEPHSVTRTLWGRIFQLFEAQLRGNLLKMGTKPCEIHADYHMRFFSCDVCAIRYKNLAG